MSATDLLKPLDQQIEEFKRSRITALLEHCNESQIAGFHRIFPKGVNAKDLDEAIKLCQRTLRLNSQKELP